jgi:hypothetical protein
MSDHARAHLLKIAVAAAMLAGMLLSWRLWLPDRFYPLVPVADWFPPVPAWLGALWLWTLVALLWCIAVLPWPRIWLGSFVILATALALWDQTRWQPWFYQYLAMLLCLWVYPWKKPATGERYPRALHACRLIVAFTYLYSGLQKFNISFATEVYPWLIEPLVPAEASKLAAYGGLLPPVIEVFLGVALLIPSFRVLGILIALGMHSGILYCLGPRGHNWNTVVWPWNVAMMVFVVVLFAGTRKTSFWSLVWPGRSVLQWAILVLFAVMPAFNFVGRWDSYLSAALYSGNTVKANLFLSRAVFERLPEEVRPYLIDSFDGRYCLTSDGFMDWSISEMNVPNYPAERVYHGIFRALTSGPGEPLDCELVIHHPPSWLTGKRKTTVYSPWGVIPEEPEPAAP